MNLKMPRLVAAHVLKGFVLAVFVIQPTLSQASMSGSVNALSALNIGFSATNVVSGAMHCASLATANPKPPKLPWAPCPSLAASIPMLAMALMQAGENRQSGDQIDSFVPEYTTGDLGTTTAGGGLNFTNDPSTTGGGDGGGYNGGGPGAPGGPGVKLPPLNWGEFCSKTPDFCDECAKGGNFESCKPKMILPEDVDTSLFNTPELKEALATFHEAADLINSLDSQGAGGGDSSDLVQGDDSDFGFGGEDGVWGDAEGSQKNKGLGLANKTGLGAASSWGMDMVDESTGSKLTLFQRATRRYYGAPEFKRLNFLARSEFVRSRAIAHAKLITKDPKKAAAKAQNFVPRRESGSLPGGADSSAPLLRQKSFK